MTRNLSRAMFVWPRDGKNKPGPPLASHAYKITMSEEMHEWIAEQARKRGCSYVEVIRSLVWSAMERDRAGAAT